MYEIARAEFFYMQDYCGCIFSREEGHQPADCQNDQVVVEP